MEEELKQAQELLTKLYNQMGSSADSDMNLWKGIATYCKEKGLIKK